MANTSKLKTEVEKWYRDYLTEDNLIITQEEIELEWGGKFEVDAAVKSNNELIEVHCLSISEYKTNSNNNGIGKYNKIKADALMLMGIKCEKKILAFFGKTMYEKIKNEQNVGRFPKEIQLKYIPEEKYDPYLRKIIHEVRDTATKEITK